MLVRYNNSQSTINIKLFIGGYLMENKELEKEITDEKTGISYTLVGDYYLPNLKLQQEEKIQLNKSIIRSYYIFLLT